MRRGFTILLVLVVLSGCPRARGPAPGAISIVGEWDCVRLVDYCQVATSELAAWEIQEIEEMLLGSIYVDTIVFYENGQMGSNQELDITIVAAEWFYEQSGPYVSIHYEFSFLEGECGLATAQEITTLTLLGHDYATGESWRHSRCNDAFFEVSLHYLWEMTRRS